MTLLDVKDVFHRIERVVNIVNTTIGAIKASYTVKGDAITIKFFTDKDNEVGEFILENIMQLAMKKEYPFSVCTFDKAIEFTYELEGIDMVSKNKGVTADIVDILYQVVDMAKVEYCLTFEYSTEVELSFDILCEIDQWNEDQEYYGDDTTGSIVDYTRIRQYRMDKNCLYGTSLGYYDIDMSIVESDLVPELIGILFKSTEDFCYVISDDKYINFYSIVPFNEDIEFDIEEGLMNCLHLLSQTNQEETLEDLWSEFCGGVCYE